MSVTHRHSSPSHLKVHLKAARSGLGTPKNDNQASSKCGIPICLFHFQVYVEQLLVFKVCCEPIGGGCGSASARAR